LLEGICERQILKQVVQICIRLHCIGAAGHD
jgi:hypothetical protein